MAISAEHLKPSQADRISEPTGNTPIQRLIDEGTVYVPQSFTLLQFATLSALFDRLPCPATENPVYVAAGLDGDLTGGGDASIYRLGLDEMNSLSWTRTGYAFAELTPEIQDAMLELVTAGDLASDKLNLARWLEELRGWAVHSSLVTR